MENRLVENGCIIYDVFDKFLNVLIEPSIHNL